MDDRFDIAEKTREKGDPQAARALFTQLLSEAVERKDQTQVMAITLQLGLCYEHMDQYGKALILYQNALKKALESQNLTFQVLALRHIISVYLETKMESEALAKSHSMMDLLAKLDYRPSNGCWIIHGHIKALKQNGSPRDIVAKLALKEAKELWYAFDLVESYKFWIWSVGWLSDMAYGFAPIGWLLYIPAYLISLIAGLKLRQRQFRKGIGKNRI